MRPINLSTGIVALAGALGGAVSAQATPFAIGPNGTPGYTPEPVTETLSFAQSAVPLTGATLTLSGTALDFLNFISLGNTQATAFTGNVTGGAVTVSLGSTLLLSDSISVPSTSGTVPAAATFTEFNEAAATNPLSLSVALTSAELASFVGTGPVSLTVGFAPQTVSGTFDSQNGKVLIGADAAASGDVSLAYAVPEPVSLALFATGLLGLVMVRSRRA